MQTAVEFLIQQIVKPINNEYTEHSLYEKALELEKKQIICAYTEGNRLEFYDASETIGKQYYNETYGSKGSDDQVPDVMKMVDKEEQKGILVELMELDSKDGLYNPSSQTEISDEEIERKAIDAYLKVKNIIDTIIYTNKISEYSQGHLITIIKEMYVIGFKEQLRIKK